jgi:hypothetical protein
MFGGIVFMVYSKMCVSVGKTSIMRRIDPAIHSGMFSTPASTGSRTTLDTVSAFFVRVIRLDRTCSARWFSAVSVRVARHSPRNQLRFLRTPFSEEYGRLAIRVPMLSMLVAGRKFIRNGRLLLIHYFALD